MSRSREDPEALLLLNLKGGGANVVQDAVRAIGLAGFADAATVEDEEVGEKGSLPFGYDLQEVPLYLFGVALAGQTEPVG